MTIRVLNLGAGVQSTTLAIMAQMNFEARLAGDPHPYPHVGEFQCAVFGDTGDEPWAVYKHLVWLALRCTSFPILVRSIHPKRNRILRKLFPSTGLAKASRVTRFLAWLRRIEIGTLRGSLKTGIYGATGKPIPGHADASLRFASIPAFTWDGVTVRMTRRDGPVPAEGKTRRQCTSEWKIDCVERTIRRDVVGLQPRQRIPSGIHIEQVFGLSFDEPSRVRKTRARFETIPWATALFPLFEMEQTRGGCLTWLKKHGPPYKVARSACTECPLRANVEWAEMRDEDPASFAEACDVDDALRAPGVVINRNHTDSLLYLHRSCKPLREAPIDEPETKKLQEVLGFATECQGLCGT